MRLPCSVSVLLVIMVLYSGDFSMGKVTSDLVVVLPDTINGWRRSGKDALYDRETLYDYIDGGAELYLSYGFRKVINRTYLKPHQPDLIVDLFDMGTSQNAYGVFTHSMETVESTFGQGSQYSEGLLLFWKDRYFISILSYPETKESKEALLTLGRSIETAIRGEGSLPALLNLLPQKSLIPESVRYFRHHAWLNSHYFVADSNILLLNDKTGALLAKYRAGEKQLLLLLVEYANPQEARAARDNFVKHYLPELTHKNVVQIEDGTWTSCQLKEHLITVVFNAPEAGKALHLMNEVDAKRLQQKGGKHGG